MNANNEFRIENASKGMKSTEKYGDGMKPETSIPKDTIFNQNKPHFLITLYF